MAALRLGGAPRVPLLGKAEKAQLEELILAKLVEHFEQHGSTALLAEGVRVVVHGRGVAIDNGDSADTLAAIPLRTLFTALCYLDSPTPALPRDALPSLATEATSAAAAQINRIAST
jgi:hypothetical protein